MSYRFPTEFVLLVWFCVFPRTVLSDMPASEPNAEMIIRAPAGDSEIVITTTKRLAGAIHSLTWDGREFINSTDHGRQLQSASSFSSNGKHWAEAFNPTEAGSRADGAAANSTSRLLHAVSTSNSLQTTTRMAFWLAPGELSEEHPALNLTKLSNHLLTKRVQIGLPDLPQVVRYEVTFSLPLDERHTFAQFEALTGYMPAEFKRFETFRPDSGNLESISDGPGEQKFPLVFSTESGSHAMGIYSPQQPSTGFENAGYGRWNFGPQQVVKWNSVFRIRNVQGITAGEFSFQNFVVVGNRDTVQQALIQLHRRFPKAVESASPRR